MNREISSEERENHGQCQVSGIDTEKGEIDRCPNLTDYRVICFTEKKYLIEGQDPSQASSYQREEAEMEPQYLCRSHFDQRFRDGEAQIFAGEVPSDFMDQFEYGRWTGQYTFRKFSEG